MLQLIYALKKHTTIDGVQRLPNPEFHLNARKYEVPRMIYLRKQEMIGWEIFILTFLNQKMIFSIFDNTYFNLTKTELKHSKIKNFSVMAMQFNYVHFSEKTSPSHATDGILCRIFMSRYKLCREFRSYLLNDT
jgi:hypothetical protein